MKKCLNSQSALSSSSHYLEVLYNVLAEFRMITLSLSDKLKAQKLHKIHTSFSRTISEKAHHIIPLKRLW
jgi:hypothetical protein